MTKTLSRLLGEISHELWKHSINAKTADDIIMLNEIVDVAIRVLCDFKLKIGHYSGEPGHPLFNEKGL